MDIDTRIDRRRRQHDRPRLVTTYEALSPVTHVDTPVGRGPVLERLLDHLSPVFDGQLPPNGYVYGPAGAGKSAVVSVLFDRLGRLLTTHDGLVQTSIRAASPPVRGFVYVDTRIHDTPFGFYRKILSEVVSEQVPERGLGTETIRGRLHDTLDASRRGAVVAIDHIDDPHGLEQDRLDELFRGLPAAVSWLAVGRSAPEQVPLTRYTPRSIRVEEYQDDGLIDLLMTRASDGLAPQTFSYDVAEAIAGWADGNAHDALAVLLMAALEADDADADHLSIDRVETAMDRVPRPAVPIARVLTLPTTWQSVLRRLVDLDDPDLDSVGAIAEAIATTAQSDLSPSTIERVLYQAAELGVLARVRTSRDATSGRPASRLEPRFPVAAFRWLYDHEVSVGGVV